MLRRVTQLITVAATACLVVGALPNRAAADHEVYCPPGGGDCIVKAHTPRQPGQPGPPGGGGGGGGGESPCTYTLASPQPPAGHSSWEGHAPGDGAVYTRVCVGDDGTVSIQLAWLATPPGAPSPAVLAALAVSRLPIRGPNIGVAPDPDGSGLVGVPVWLWTAVTPSTWGPISATASVPGLSVTATANATKIVWDMGNGHSVTCTNPGTPHTGQAGKSPTCGYDGYPDPSSTKPGGRYKITGTTTWHVTWAGGGTSGVLDVTRQSSTTIDIGELPVVTR